jgi:hypothetical protein
MKHQFMMRTKIMMGAKTLFYLLLSCMVFQSCLYTQKSAIKKFCNKDTLLIETIIHDTIIVDSIQVDTIFSESIDSVYLFKDKIEIRYIKKNGVVYLQGKCKGDTIFYTKTIYQKVPCITPKLVWYKQLGADYWYILPIIILIFLSIKYFHKILNNG